MSLSTTTRLHRSMIGQKKPAYTIDPSQDNWETLQESLTALKSRMMLSSCAAIHNRSKSEGGGNMQFIIGLIMVGGFIVSVIPVIEWFKGYSFSLSDFMLIGIGLLLVSFNLIVIKVEHLLEDFKNIYERQL